MTTRFPSQDQRSAEVTKHFAATIEHLGRALYALERGDWDSARNHLTRVAERASITDVCLNVGSPDAKATLASVRERLPKEWADSIAAFLAGGTGRAATASGESGTSRNDPEQLDPVPYVSGQHRTGDADA
ncbi:hypothetical protein ACFYUV_20775 [Nonomuraea sp. NPDC003560]|uniref:hypothetical protein n=1 Tax=Nonomuraea sp. NPDC003560 TaxID=3364341 RepID=UPI0036B86C09